MPSPDWLPWPLRNVEGRSATLLVHGTIEDIRRVVVDTLDAKGWVLDKRYAPALTFRQRIFGLIPGNTWVEVGISMEDDGVVVSFTAYGSVGPPGGEGGGVWQIADGLARAFARRLSERAGT
jgi:hypothetical protein